MRAALMFAMLGLIGAVGGCGQKGPFEAIAEVKVRHIGETGLTEKKLTKQLENQVIQCLYQTSQLSDESEALRDLLQTTYLIEVSDANGDRSFELYTLQNLKGNRGKYYFNNCLHDIIQRAG